MKKSLILTTLALALVISPVFSQINLKSAANKVAGAKEKLTSDKSDKSDKQGVSNVIPKGTATLYVSQSNGSNRNDGSKDAPFKNIQKAIDQAPDGATILVAEGNYFGMLTSGNINLNKQADLTIPGGGKFMRIWANDFDDVEQLAKVSGNKTLTDPKIFKGIINEAYLEGFLSAAYEEKTSYDPNSSANQFRQAMGMNMTGTINSKASMFANRYPWKEALKFFGAMEGYGAQNIK